MTEGFPSLALDVKLLEGKAVVPSALSETPVEKCLGGPQQSRGFAQHVEGTRREQAGIRR